MSRSAEKRTRRIANWDPEDVVAWDAGGSRIARRNLIWSVIAEHVGFSVWSIWSVMVLFMPVDVYHIDAAGKFFLIAMPTLVGAVLRIPYTTVTARFGGRNWTIFSALVLLVPLLLTMYAMAHPGLSYTAFMVIAAVAGFGGGNFASSMTNINAFYPQRLKGWALGLNAGGGNIGVTVVQLLGLLVIATVGDRSPQIVLSVYLVLVGFAALGAALFMDNLDGVEASGHRMVEVLRYPDSWAIAFLYIGTFGSFIGFSFAFGQVLQLNFLAEPGTTAASASLHAAQIAFLGPLLGSLTRPIGGLLADRIGGGKITLGCFAAMTLAAGTLVVAGTRDDATPGAATGGVFAAYLIGFIALFLLSGLGNGSVYKLIPAVFADHAARLRGVTPDEAAAWARAMSGALIGVAGAVGALGGVGINLVLRASYSGSAHSATMAFWVFLGFYALCIGVTWLRYIRPSSHAEVPVPAPAAPAGEPAFTRR
ncbi:nitrate/nitrite transporter [Speluncibacter jeojiensis]|uniref:NarK/NasA family nitrate transporter n=1 Tax=Speluncibacter jeojiensis TaxID=2710754 RepID=A0A9X4LVL2_9ACTN|nr:NarK/NasA family nitrate transporter [Corynebacteriales bacterium D3-21]